MEHETRVEQRANIWPQAKWRLNWKKGLNIDNQMDSNLLERSCGIDKLIRITR